MPVPNYDDNVFVLSHFYEHTNFKVWSVSIDLVVGYRILYSWITGMWILTVYLFSYRVTYLLHSFKCNKKSEIKNEILVKVINTIRYLDT